MTARGCERVFLSGRVKDRSAIHQRGFVRRVCAHVEDYARPTGSLKKEGTNARARVISRLYVVPVITRPL